MVVRRIERCVLRLGVALLALGLVSCGESAGSAKSVTQRQRVGQLTIAIETPEKPRLLTEEEIVVTIADQSGAPVDGADVWLAMVMPTMQMSPNEPDAAPAGNGRYRAKAIFTMSGVWRLEVHAHVRDQEHVVTFRTET